VTPLESLFRSEVAKVLFEALGQKSEFKAGLFEEAGFKFQEARFEKTRF
jgi:hypothetical protein